MTVQSVSDDLLLLATFLSGVFTHLTFFIHHERDASALHILAVYVLSPLTLSLIFALPFSQLWLSAFFQAITLTSSHLLGLTCSIFLYRLLFHPLRRFPGPISWRFSAIARALSIYFNGERGAVMMHDLHKRYGDTIRVGPNHVSIRSAESIVKIHGEGRTSPCSKSVAYIFPTYPASVNAERDPERHRVQRRIWEGALDSSSVQKHLPTLIAQIDSFKARLHCRQNVSIEISHELSLFVTDLMGSIGFGRPKGFDAMHSGHVPRVVADITLTWRFGVYMMLLPWLHMILDAAPDLWGLIYKSDIKVREFISEALKDRKERLEKDIVDEKRRGNRTCSTECEPRDMMAHLIRAELYGKPMNHEQLVSNGFIMSVALTDTTISTLFHLTYRLARHPDIQSMLYHELADVVEGLRNISAANWVHISRLPYLDSFINETLRLHPPNPSPFSRTTPPEGITLNDGTHIPGNVIVSTPEWSLHRDPRYFMEPESFIPERWITEEMIDTNEKLYTARSHLLLDRQAFIPFLHGPYRCPGVYLASMEIKMWLASVLGEFEVGFEKGVDDADIDRRIASEWKDYGMTHPGKLEVVFSRRQDS